MTEKVFTIENVKETIEQIKKAIDVPFMRIYHSTLGGSDRVSILMSISLDDNSKWANGIYENSRYMSFHISNSGVIEQLTKHYKIDLKFRKSTVKNIETLIKKVNEYIIKINI